MGKIVQLIPASPRTEDSLEDGSRKADSWFADGRYRILQLDGSRITVCAAGENRERRQGQLFITEMTEFSVCNLEPEVIMPVACTFSEFCGHWSPERAYDLCCLIGEDGTPQLYSIREYSDEDQTFRQLEPGRLGWLYYNVSYTSVRDWLRLVPVEIMTAERYGSYADKEDVTVLRRVGDWLLLRHTKLERLVALQPDTRYYVMTAEGGLQLTRDNVDGYFDDDTVFRVIARENRAVCVICYQVVVS